MRLKTLRDYLIITALFLVFFLLARVGFFIVFKDAAYPIGEIAKSFFIGARLDLSLTAAAVSFVFFFLGLISIFPKTLGLTSKVAKIYFTLLAIFFIFLTLAELPFFQEYNLRLNHLFFEYLDDPGELILTINAFFPVVYVIVITVVCSLLITYFICKFINKIKLFSNEKPLSKILSLLIIASLTVIFIRGGFQRRPINWGTAYFSKSNFLNQNTLNGIFNLFHDFQVYLDEKKNKIETKKYFSNKDAFNILSKNNNAQKEIKFPPPNIKVNKPNIVLIFMEGFDTKYVGSYGAKKSLAPNFDRLAKRGILFSDFYANGTRTSRALLAGLCSYPVTPGVNLIKKVQAQQKIPSVADYLKEYQSLFFYGGDKDFEDMRAFFTANGFDKFYDYKDYGKSECPNKLGIFDEELFELINKKLTQTPQPFFTTVLTLTNHEPFYLPKHFQNKRPDLTLAERVFHYSDYTLGKFIEQAAKQTYFKNTIFIITADHTKYHKKLNKDRFKIPMVIYSPLIKKPQKIDEVTSQMNLPMTILELTGTKINFSDTTFFAKSVFTPSGKAYLMIDPYFAAITKDYFYRETISGQFYLFDDEGNSVDELLLITPLQNYARANLQLSQYLFLNFKVNTTRHQKKELFENR